jgi:hypothetical protein
VSHCANYVLRRDGLQLVANSRWGALTVPADVFFGPDHTLSFLIDATEPDLDLAFHYSELMCEGAIFADYDARRLVVYGGEDLRYQKVLQHTYVALLARAWPAWDVAWAFGGWHQIAAEAAVPFEPDDHRPGRPLDAVALWTPPSGWTAPVDAASFVYNRTPDSLSLVTICDGNGARDHLIAASAARVRATGQRILEMLVAVPPASPVPAFHVAGSGLIVDLRARTVHYWFGEEERSGNADELTAAWSGWAVSRDDDGVPKHFIRTGRDPSPVAIRGSILREVVIRAALSDLAEQALATLVLEIHARALQPGVTTAAGAALLPPPHKLDSAGRRAFIASLLAQFPESE